MVITPDAGPQKFLSFCRPDTVPSGSFSTLDTPITNGATAITVPVTDQLTSWNVELLNPSTEVKRKLTIVATDGTGNYEQIEVDSISGTTVTLVDPIVNDYTTYRLGDFPITGFCHVGTSGTGLFDSNHLPSIWMGPAGFQVTSDTLGVVIRHPSLAANTPETVTGLNPSGRVAIREAVVGKTVPVFSIPGLGVTAVGSLPVDTLINQINRGTFGSEWAVFSTDVTNSSRVMVKA
jgi:hypothetical protein